MIKTLLNEKGVFTFKDEITIPTDVGFSVDAIDKASRLSAMGVKLEKEFADIGVSSDDISEVIEGSEVVYRLEGGGKSYYCPERVITKFPSFDTVPYRTFYVGVELGELPSTVDLEGVKATIKEQIEVNLGVKANVISAAKGRVTQVRQPDHRTRLTDRANDTADSDSTYAKLKRTEEKLEKANQVIAALIKGYE